MSDVFSFSSLWGEWYIKDLIGEGTFGEVYRAEKKEYGNTYISAVKHISIPSKDMSPDKLIEEGLVSNEHTVSLFYDNIRDQFINEINFCYALRGHTNIVSYEDHCIIPKKNGLGYDIFIRMEYLTALTKYMRSHNMTENDVIQLGIDICSALEVLHARNMLHRDIKPANIFVSPMGVFELGDFGESKILSDASVGMTVRGTYAYMSPEISRGNSANITADIYSLGLVMYRLLNGNRAPFIPQDAVTINAQMQEESNTRRLRGEMLPVPSNCKNQELCSIIMKACEFQPGKRWQTPTEMKNALTKLKWENQRGSDAHTVKPEVKAAVADENFRNDDPRLPLRINETLKATEMNTKNPPQKEPIQEKTGSKKKLIIPALAAVLVIAVSVSLVAIFLSKNNSSDENEQSQDNYESSDKNEQSQDNYESSDENEQSQDNYELLKDRQSPDFFALPYDCIAVINDGNKVSLTYVDNIDWEKVDEAKNWSNITMLSAGYKNLFGLCDNGKVIAVGNNENGQCNVSDWNNIIDIDACYEHTVGLKSDGTAVAVGKNTDMRCNVEKWADLAEISAGFSHTVGLKKDGNVLVTGGNEWSQSEILNWKNIKSISAGYYHTVGLKTDGTVIAQGNNKYGQCNVEKWTDVASVYAGKMHTVALKNDGTVLAVGNNDYGQCNISEWKNIVELYVEKNYTVGRTSSGELLVTGLCFYDDDISERKYYLNDYIDKLTD